MSGCATTQYTINGIEPKSDNSTQLIKTVGTIVVLGAVAKGLANKNCTPNNQTIRDNTGKVIGTINNCN